MTPTQEPAPLRDPDRPRSGVPEWAYLGFLAFVFVPPVFAPDTTWIDWVIVSLVVVVSAAVYVVAAPRRPLRLRGAVVLLVLGVAVTPIGTGAMSVLPIYAAALSATEGSRDRVYRRLVLITLVTIGAVFLSPIPMPFLLLVFVSPVLLIWVVGLSALADVHRSDEAHRLRAENARIEYLATVTERERIARDLHDLAGQALTAVVVRSQLVQRLAHDDPDRVVGEAEAIETAARQTLASLRETIAGWRQVSLDEERDGAIATLSAAGVEARAGDGWNVDLAPSVETVLALALREAVTNVVRHAHATSCEMSLVESSAEVLLVVRDDGTGTRAPEGSGLTGMRERVVAAGGRMEVLTGGGTEVRVSIPVAGRPDQRPARHQEVRR